MAHLTPEQEQYLNGTFDVFVENLPVEFVKKFKVTHTGENLLTDSRRWYITRRYIGETSDMIGGFSSNERYKLVDIINTLKFSIGL